MVSAGRVVDRHGARHLGGKCQGGTATAVWSWNVAHSSMLKLHAGSELSCCCYLQSIIREAFANAGRIVNGFFSWVLAAVPKQRELSR